MQLTKHGDGAEEQVDPEWAKRRRVEKAKARHIAEWEPPSEEVRAGPYRMEFGKHSKKTVAEVQQVDSGYFAHMLATTQGTLLKTHPRLKVALQAEGLLDDLVATLPQNIRALYEKTLAIAVEALASAQKLHPEVLRCRKLQQIKSSRVLADLDKREDALALVAKPAANPTSGHRRRRMRSVALTLLPHCSTCGAITHKSPSCPWKDMVDDGVPDRTRRTIAYEQDKHLGKVVGRLRYTRIGLRTHSYDKRPRQRSRASQKRGFKLLIRAKPSELHAILIEDQLLRDLNGAPCPRENCEKPDDNDWRSSQKVLGPVRYRDKSGPDINTHTVFHRCVTCSKPQSVALYNPLFQGLVGKSSLGISYVVQAFWNYLEEVSVTKTAKQLQCSEGSVGYFFDRAKDVMAHDALWLQERIQWGTGTDRTSDVELDCTVVAKWRLLAPPAGPDTVASVCDNVGDLKICDENLKPGQVDPEVVGSGNVLRYKYYTWIGRVGFGVGRRPSPCMLILDTGEGV